MVIRAGKVILLCCLSLKVGAAGVSPYLPLQTSPEIEAVIEQVMAVTPGAPLTKPYKAADLLQRAELLKDSYPHLYSYVDRYLKRFTKPSGITHKSIGLAAASGQEKALPNQRGLSTEDNFEISAAGFNYINPYVYLAYGGNYGNDNGLVPTSSFIAFGHEYIQIDIGYREHWFSPFQDSAMLISTNAETSPSITLSNAKPISERWNIRYEFFYTVLEPQSAIVLGDTAAPGRPRLAGFHLSFTPLANWSLGLNRTLQFGGGERQVSFGDFFEAFFDPAGKDNVGDVETDDPNFEFGNQQASINSKWNFHWYTPISFYVELAGEDTTGESNFSLGNQAWSYGLFLPQLTRNLALRYEVSDWTTAWYVHPLYSEGYSNSGRVLGHFGASERVFNDDTPATVHSLNARWISGAQIFDTTLRLINNDDSVAADYESAYELQFRYSKPYKKGFIGSEVYFGSDTFGESFGRLSVFYRW